MAESGYDYLVAFNLHTCGAVGEELGTDESDIILIAWAIVDAKQNTTVSVDEIYVKPSTQLNFDGPLLCGVTTDLIRNAVSLSTALDKFDTALSTTVPSGSKYCLVTDGMLPLRQCLFPEAINRKGITLHDHFYQYFDIIKEFHSSFHPDQEFESLTDILYHLKITLDNDQPYGTNVVKVMAQVIDQILYNGHQFLEPYTIQKEVKLNQPVNADLVQEDCVVRLRGLPFSAGAEEVATFLAGLDLIDGGLVVCLSPHGRRNGEALACFKDKLLTELAIARHKHHMGKRYIEVYNELTEEFLDHTGASSNVSTVSQGIIRMQGLPFRATEDEIVEWFEGTATVSSGRNGVLISRYVDGRATGDAFVLFDTEEEATKALKKDRESMGNRYIVLFLCPFVELQKVLDNANSRMETEAFLETLYGEKHVPFASSLDCVKLTGLPYSATADDVVNFFNELADDIKTSGIHMVLNTQAKPTGDCYVEMNNVEAAERACQQLHREYMGKRYIEVFQCSASEVKTALSTGGIKDTGGRSRNGSYQKDIGRGNRSGRDRGRRQDYRYDSDRSSGYGNRDYDGRGGGANNYDRSRPPKRRNYGVTVRVRGIPFSTTEDELADFFQEYNVDPNDVKIGFNRDGRPSGDALVTFSSAELAREAVREKNRKHLGHRYLELFVES